MVPGPGEYTFTEALLELRLRKHEAQIVELRLLNGTYRIGMLAASLVRFDSTVLVSEVRIIGDVGGAILEGDANPGRRLAQSVIPSSPPAALPSSPPTPTTPPLYPPPLSPTRSPPPHLPPHPRVSLLEVLEGAPPLALSGLTVRHSALLPAISVLGGQFSMNACRLESNSASALLVTGGRVDVSQSVFHANGATSASHASLSLDGGAISVRGGELIISDSVFEDNVAHRGGAIFYDGEGTYWVRHTAFQGNLATTQGGAIFARNCSVTLTKETILEGNQAGQMGGNAFVHSTAVLTYALPAPAGFWIPNPLQCRDERNAAHARCTRQAEHATLTVWETTRPFDDDFPYICAAGLVGSNTSEEHTQSSAQCAGPCPAGKHCTAGMQEIVDCKAGYYCPRGSPNQVPCEPGLYNPATGQRSEDACLPCRPGFYCRFGESAQQPCPANYFSGLPHATDSEVCQECPTNAQTRGLNSTERDHCKCSAGYYRHDDNVSKAALWDCRACFVGVACPTSGSTLRRLDVRPGFFRISSSTTDVRRCHDAGVGCGGGRSICANSMSGCKGGSNPQQACHDSLAGVFCLLCSAWLDGNATKQQYYVAATDVAPPHCEDCSSRNWRIYLVVPAIIVLLVLAPERLIWLLQKRPRVSQLLKKWHFKKWHFFLGDFVATYTLPTKLKLLISFHQVASRVGDVYDLFLPTVHCLPQRHARANPAHLQSQRPRKPHNVTWAYTLASTTSRECRSVAFCRWFEMYSYQFVSQSPLALKASRLCVLSRTRTSQSSSSVWPPLWWPPLSLSSSP